MKESTHTKAGRHEEEIVETTPSVKYTDTPPQRGINGGENLHRPTKEEVNL